MRDSLPTLVAMTAAATLAGCGDPSDRPGESPSDAGEDATATTSDAGTTEACVRADPAGEGQVLTSTGVVEGTETADGHAFLGIPYAAPPVGPLRFRPPARAGCWSDVRPAVSFGSECPQVGAGDAFVGGEDCLTLNVWSPSLASGSALPVLVFLHGGFNVQGSSRYELGGVRVYDGSHLAARGPAVVVTINYRVGALGFLAHPALAGDGSDPPGNYGLRDQIAALEWVRDNIAAFGGDPSRVLLFGQSAGSIDTCALLAAPAADGLFHRAMLLSGACAALPRDAAVEMADELVRNVGCAEIADVAACLRRLSPREIVTATFGPTTSTEGSHPTIDGVLLPMAPDEMLATGAARDVPVIVSATAEEFTILATGLMTSPLEDQPTYEAAVRLLFREGDPTMTQIRRLELVRAPDPIAEGILETYPYAAHPSGNAALVAVLSDLFYVCPARRTLRALATGGLEGRRAIFTGSLSAGPLAVFGAAHGIDLLFGFRTLDAFGHAPTAEESRLADAIGDAWVRFAATGDPSGDELAWPTYPSHLELGFPIEDGIGFHEEGCDFWDSVR